jgi:hypothetical protein
MILTAKATLEKIRADQLPYWKLHTVDKYNREKIRMYGQFNEKELDKSLDVLQKQIEVATEFEDCIFYIEARASISANQDGIKSWYFKSLARNNTTSVSGGYGGEGLGILERPFVQNMLSGIEHDKQWVQQQKDQLFGERFQIQLDKALMERDKKDFEKEKSDWAAEKKKLEERSNNRVQVGLNTIGIALENLLAAGAKNPEALNGVVSAIIRGEDIAFGKKGEAEALANKSPEEVLIEEMATYIYDCHLPLEALEALKKNIMATIEHITQKSAAV